MFAFSSRRLDVEAFVGALAGARRVFEEASGLGATRFVERDVETTDVASTRQGDDFMTSDFSKRSPLTNESETVDDAERIDARKMLDSASFDDASTQIGAPIRVDSDENASSVSVVLPILSKESDVVSVVGWEDSNGESNNRTVALSFAPTSGDSTTAANSVDAETREWVGSPHLESDRTVVSNEPPIEVGLRAVPLEKNDDGDSFASGEGADPASGRTGDPNDPKNGGALPPGTRFGHFVVTKYIGGGGMGRVYEGVDAALDRKVAIKVLAKQRAQDGATVARFLNEAKSAARLNHEHIAQVYFCGEENGVPYIAFEYVSGTNLRDYVRERGVLELGEAIDYVLQAADALAHAAAHGVTHRDVKPSNIIVTPQKRAKLIDMGLARLLKSDVSDDLTESGVTLGTFDYISPEQARDPRVADVRSDIYSLGCTFYYMLVGTPPFPDGTVLQKLLQHQGDEAPDVREANPTVPVEVAAVLKKMMRKNPEERYQTPEALISDLYQIAEMIGLRLSERNVANSGSPNAKAPAISLRRLPGVCAIGVFLGLVAVYYWSSRGVDVRLPVVDVEIAAAPTGSVANASAPTASADVVPGAVPKVEPTAAFVENPAGSRSDSVLLAPKNVGKILDVAALDDLYAVNFENVERTPAVLVDDGREWRRAFLGGSATVAATRRVAAGWRARTLENSSGNDGFLVGGFGWTRGASAPTLDAASVVRVVSAYSFLGASLDVATSSVPTNATRTVDRLGTAPQTFATLQAALGGDRDFAVPLRVELKFNGALETPPISLAGSRVEIVAAEGFRPTLLFKPTDAANGGWGERMFLLNDCELTLDGVSVDFTVPSQEVVASKWSVFESLGATSLTIRNATLTVCNMTGDTFVAPLHSNVALFRSTAQTTLDAATNLNVSKPAANVGSSVRLKNVLARCEATVFATERVEGLFAAENSGFNASGPILQLGSEEGRTVETNELSGVARPRFLLTFDRVVAIGRTALARFDEEDGATKTAVPLDLSLTNSIVRLDSAPLAVVYSSRPLEGDWEAGSDWKLDGSVLFDVAAFRRTRLRRSSQFSDSPVRKSSVFDSKILSELSPEASERLTAIPPHSFEISDFSRWILNPMRTSTAIGDLFRANAEEIKTNFVDGANF